jgi:PAS domain S-box-containing protein
MGDRVRELEEELERLRDERDSLAGALEKAMPFETAVSSSPVSVICVNAEKGRYEFANQAFANLIGRPLDEILATDPYEIFVAHTHPDDIEAEHDAIGRIAKGEIDRYHLDKRFVTPEGEVRWVRATGVGARKPSGRLERLTVYFADIHEQRDAASSRERVEAQLRQAQKLDALGKLAGGVAHDFNNRLLIIIGYTELLRRGLVEDSELARHADAVLASAHRGAELTRQLLAYSRRQVLKPEPFDLNQAVDRMRCLLERVIGDRIQLVTTLGAANAVFSDPGQIEQVILNLAINARDAMPEGGQLTLETGDASLGAGEDQTLREGDYVTLSVGDQGLGIPDEVLPHIFEPFFTTKPVGQGTGLGLSMVEGIVRQSGGAVRVSTRLTHGTKFTVYLPRARDVPVERYAAESAQPQDLQFETVLVCDDDDDVRKLLVDVLSLRAYRILQARNGKHALEIAGAHDGPIHLLVTDVVMPELDGVALASALRRAHPALRVLYVSGYTDDAAILSAPLGPDTQFLAKPFLPGDLTRAVIGMLERRPSA